ncbi:MAG: repressor LexA [Planctomycetes bacterium]|nr:repressor LexA [Planctomycetota bacterium]
MPQNITKRQKEFLEFILQFRRSRGRGPSRQEIAEAFGVGKASARDVADALVRSGHLHKSWDGELMPGTKSEQSEAKNTVAIPWFGKIPASPPREAFPGSDLLEIDRRLLGSGKYYALEVDGPSMVEAQIEDGDIVIIREQQHARDGQIISALLNGEVTLKEYSETPSGIALRPRNAAMKLIPIKDTDEFQIQGVLWRWIKSASE